MFDRLATMVLECYLFRWGGTIGWWVKDGRDRGQEVWGVMGGTKWETSLGQIGGGELSVCVFALTHQRATSEALRVCVAGKSVKVGFVKSWKMFPCNGRIFDTRLRTSKLVFSEARPSVEPSKI